MSGEAQERNVVMEESNVGAQNSDDTLVVLEFSPKAPAETKEWLTALIKAPGVFVIICPTCNSNRNFDGLFPCLFRVQRNVVT